MKLSDLLLKQTGWRTLNYASAFILNICISRLFNAEGSGMYFYIINYLSFLVLLTSLSLESGIGYYIPSGKINLESISALVILWIAAIGVFCYWGFPLWGHWMESGWPEETLRKRATIFVIGSMLSAYFTAIMNARFHYVFSNLTIFITNLLISMVLIYTYFYKVLTIDTLFQILFLNYLLQGIILFIFFIFFFKISFSFQKIHLKPYAQLVRYSLFAFVINILSFLLSRFDYFLVKHFCNTADLGNYILANKMAQVFYLLPAILASVLFNYTAKGEEGGAREKISQASRMLTSLYLLLFLMVFLFKDFFVLVFGESFDKTHTLLLMMMPGILLFGITHLLTAYLSGRNRLAAIFSSTLIAFVCLLISDILLIPHYGVYAASAVTVFAYIILFVLLVRALNPHKSIRWSELIFLRIDDWQYMKLLFARIMKKQ